MLKILFVKCNFANLIKKKKKNDNKEQKLSEEQDVMSWKKEIIHINNDSIIASQKALKRFAFMARF